MPVVTYTADITPGQVVTWQIPQGTDMRVESVLATIDATAAGDVNAELELADQSGQVIAAVRQSSPVPAGDTGRATWAIRLADESAAAAALITTDGPTTVDPTKELVVSKYLRLLADPGIALILGTGEWCMADFQANGQSAPHAPTFWVGAAGVTAIWTARRSQNWSPFNSPPFIDPGNAQHIVIPETGLYAAYARMWGQTATARTGSIAGGLRIAPAGVSYSLASGGPQEAGYFPAAPLAGFNPLVQQIELFEVNQANMVLTFEVDYQGAGVVFAGNVGGLVLAKVKN